MKAQLNKAAVSAGKYGEVYLFTELAKLIEKNTNSIFISKTHGRRGWVEFKSKLTGCLVTKEISDLMILCFDQPSKEIKLSFLQAKFHSKNIQPFLDFHGDYLQLELLKNRPNISPNSSYSFPTNILNFSKYKSLTTYGIFYYDNKKQLDLLYSVAQHLEPKTSIRKTKKKTNPLQGKITFPGSYTCPRTNCFSSNGVEMETTCNLDTYINGLLTFQIGAPVKKNSKIENYLFNLLRYVGTTTGILNEYYNFFSENIYENINFNIENNPNILIIKTYSEYTNRYNEI